MVRGGGVLTSARRGTSRTRLRNASFLASREQSDVLCILPVPGHVRPLMTQTRRRPRHGTANVMAQAR
ncbi:hypothetical protein E2C01_044221 [Portunus trituberculatus]|uniref:Uncharacterized protein n=1 Tax=Portunus trituberculatus TaxID=210409 RepID=A0A5B7G1Q0_PORTR|nr:hypothetical protein [Portunus trituberculatus]